MKFIVPGLVIGMIVNFFIYNLEAGTEVSPLWTGILSAPSAIQLNEDTAHSKEIIFPYQYMDNLYIVNAHGLVSKEVKPEGGMITASGNGKYYIMYEKVGSEIQFFDISGAPYWKMKSREYPYVSYNGKLLLLLNGDQSRIRIADFNGNIIGAGEISGRLCTVIAFSSQNDYAAAGFADGSYCFINENGSIINQGSTPGLTLVKSIAVSNNAQFGIVHYGDTQNDFLMCINLNDKTSETIKLAVSHMVKCPLYISDTGEIVIIEKSKLTKYLPDGEVVFELAVPEMKEGQASINFNGGFYAISYSGLSGESYLGILRNDGTVVFFEKFINDSFLVNMFIQGVILAKGSTGLYCYSLHVPAVQK